MTDIRIIDIAIYLLAFNIALYMINFMIVSSPELSSMTGFTKQVFGMDWLIANTQSFSDSITNKGAAVGGSSVDIQSVFSWFNIIWKGFVLVISVVTTLIISIVGGVGSIFNAFFPDNIMIQFVGWLLQAFVWFIYGIGFAQWLSGRGFREYQ